MSNELKESIDGLHRTFNEFKQVTKAANEDMAKKGYVDSLLQAQQDRLNEGLTKLEAQVADAKKAADDAQLAFKRQGGAANDDPADAANKKLKSALMSYFVEGERISYEDRNLLTEHSKAMTALVGSDGGFAVTPQVETGIIEKIRLTSPLRQYAEVITVSKPRIEFTIETGDFETGWVGEIDPRPVTDTGTFGTLAIDVCEQYAQPAVSQRLLDDAYFDVEAYVTRKIADALGRSENSAFFTGDGVKRPRGLLTYPNGTSGATIQQVVSGSATSVTWQNLLDLIDTLPTQYQTGAVFMMNQATLTKIRKIVDNNGNPIWLPAFDASVGNIYGTPIIIMPDMPLPTTNALAIAYGNLKEAYLIADRLGIRVLRDPLTTKGFVKIYTTKRVGGGVKNFDALKFMKIST